MDLPKYVKDLKELLELMRRNDLAELEIEESGQRVRLRKSEPNITAAPISLASAPSAASAPLVAAGGAPSAAGGEAATDESFHVVKSPLVGTFYRASSPEADPLATEGDRIDDDRVLCIIEAMKVMNEIKSEVRGVITQVLVENAKPVEFGQPLYNIRPV
jgi:acetyl-CoA carboxylase biotin carboxyl carrier protein